MTYKIAPGTSHIYIQDQQGNYVAKSMDSSRENFHRIERLIEAANSVAGIPDPAAALKAAREALEWTLEQAEDWRGSLTGSDLLEEYDEKLTVARAALAALAALKGEQP